jgi:hypothetical protein
MEQEDSETGRGSGRARRKPRLVLTDEEAALRVPPHSLEAEQAVLGGLLLDNSTWDSIADRLHATDFYRRDHQLIFEAILDLSQKGEPSDAVTLAERLATKGLAEETGGAIWIPGNREEFGKLSPQVITEIGAEYLFAYSTERQPNDTKFHAISVYATVPGLQVRSRRGIYANVTAKREARISDSMDSKVAGRVLVSQIQPVLTRLHQCL